MALADSKRRFTTDDYHDMADAGILSPGERVELLDGEVVAMTPIGPRHNASLNQATHAFVSAVGTQAIVQIQGSVRLGLFQEPQPDIALLRPRADNYSSQLAGPADILLIVEVADSSLEQDRAMKSRIYAEAGIREYWLANLRENVLVCHSDPEGGAYRQIQRLERGQSIAPRALPACVIGVEVLIPD